MSDNNPLLCDFCSAANPVCEYECSDFTALEHPATGEPMAISEGGWLACKDCAALIDADDRAGLAERAWGIHKVMYPFIHDGIKADLIEGHRRFFARRKARKSILQ